MATVRFADGNEIARCRAPDGRSTRIGDFAPQRCRAGTGTPLGHRNVQRRGFEVARDKAELPDDLTFHDLRHAFASLAAHRGVPIQVLSAALGHADIGVTQRVYVHLFGREQAEEAFRKAMTSEG